MKKRVNVPMSMKIQFPGFIHALTGLKTFTVSKRIGRSSIKEIPQKICSVTTLIYLCLYAFIYMDFFNMHLFIRIYFLYAFIYMDSFFLAFIY